MSERSTKRVEVNALHLGECMSNPSSMPYLWVFLASLLVDLVPIIGPPAWTVMVVLMMKFDLNPWLVLAVGVPASVLGRYTLSLYTPWLSKKIIKRRKNDELEFVGRKLKQKLWQSWTFVLVYSLSPLPTTPLFSAAGLAKISPLHVLPPFFVGKFISDAVMLFMGRTAITSVGDLIQGTFSIKGIIFAVLSVLIICGFLFLDWRTLLAKKQVRFNVHIWK
jgi:membrane protein YqaA with SNARE-associated domain